MSLGTSASAFKMPSFPILFLSDVVLSFSRGQGRACVGIGRYITLYSDSWGQLWDEADVELSKTRAQAGDWTQGVGPGT